MTYCVDGFSIGAVGQLGMDWSQLGISLGYAGRRFFVGAQGGIAYHLADADWSWDPAFGGGFGRASIGYDGETVAVVASTTVQNTALRVSTTTGGGEAFSQDILSYRVAASAPIVAYRGDSALLFLVPELAFQGEENLLAVQSLPKREFDKELQLTLVSSRPLRADEITSQTVRATLPLGVWAAHATKSDVLWGATTVLVPVLAHNVEFGTYFMFSGSADLFVGFFPFEGQDPKDSHLELHLRASTQIAADDDTPVFMLPSLGNGFGMRTVKPGERVAPQQFVGAFGIGPSYVQAFVEVGVTFDADTTEALVGGGVVATFPRVGSWEMSRRSAQGVVSALPELVIGGSPEGFALELRIAGKF